MFLAALPKQKRPARKLIMWRPRLLAPLSKQKRSGVEVNHLRAKTFCSAAEAKRVGAEVNNVATKGFSCVIEALDSGDGAWNSVDGVPMSLLVGQRGAWEERRSEEQCRVFNRRLVLMAHLGNLWKSARPGF